jgi:hypothetical protein
MYSVKDLVEKCTAENIGLEPCVFNGKVHKEYKMVKYSNSKTDSEALKLYRGAIFSTDKLFIQFPQPINLTKTTQNDPIKISKELKNIRDSNKNIVVEELIDGPLFRLAFFGEEVVGGNGWLLSTNRKEDAREAYWMSEVSFFDQFIEALTGIVNSDLNTNEFFFECFTEKLNVQHTYIFTMCHPSSQIVVKYTVPRIVHLGTIDTKTYKEIPNEVLHFDETRISQPEILSNDLNNIDDIYPGVIIRTEDPETGIITRWRFECEQYKKLRVLRGDESIIPLIIIRNYNEDTIYEFSAHYYDYYDDCLFITEAINKLAFYLNTLYTEIYKKGNKTLLGQISPDLKTIVKKIHSDIFIKSKQNNVKKIIEKKSIHELLKSLKPALILSALVN